MRILSRETLIVILFSLPITCTYGNNQSYKVFPENIIKTENEIVVRKIKSYQIKNLIEQRNGKTLLLNIWATWCIPCREELPVLNKLLNYYSGDKLDIITISVDYPDEINKKILPFLKSINAGFPVFVAEISDDTELINLLNPKWNGSLPATFIYNKNGKQAGSLIGKNNFESFKDAIDNVKE